jgi:NAD(P)H-hydrate epimerase
MGAGMVSIAAPEAAVPIYRAGDPGLVVSAMTPETNFDSLLGQRRVSAALVGPGNGSGRQTRANVIAALRSKLPVVIDADGLTSFEDAPEDLFGWIKGVCVLTPHTGEFARLFPEAIGGRLDRARAAARQSGAVVVLKGADTVIAAPDGRALINANAPASLATAGSGDVLAGMIAAALAQGAAALDAAAAAVWLHGEAARRFGAPVGLIAEDLPDQLPRLLAELANKPT